MLNFTERHGRGREGECRRKWGRWPTRSVLRGFTREEDVKHTVAGRVMDGVGLPVVLGFLSGVVLSAYSDEVCGGCLAHEKVLLPLKGETINVAHQRVFLPFSGKWYMKYTCHVCNASVGWV